MIDEQLTPQVASRLRSLRQEIAKNQEAEKTAFAQAPKFDEEDFPTIGHEEEDAPTMWETPAFDNEATFNDNRLGSAIPIVPEEPEHTERSLIPLIEPVKPLSDPLHPAEYTRREPIPMELFFETAEPSSVPMSSRPKKPIVQPSSVVEHASGSIEEPIESMETQEHTMLDIAAAMGLAPEMEPMQLQLDEDTFDEPKEPAKLPLPEQIPELDLSSFVEEEKQKKRSPREGFGSDDIRRYAQAAETTSKLLPVTLGIFVIIATLYAMVLLFHSTVQARDEHVELRFLATLNNGTSAQLGTREGAKVARVYIETFPPVLVLHNREILGKTPLTVDLPLDLGEEIGVELTGPYYETWIAQVHKEALGEEYRIRAELTKK